MSAISEYVIQHILGIVPGLAECHVVEWPSRRKRQLAERQARRMSTSRPINCEGAYICFLDIQIVVVIVILLTTIHVTYFGGFWPFWPFCKFVHSASGRFLRDCILGVDHSATHVHIPISGDASNILNIWNRNTIYSRTHSWDTVYWSTVNRYRTSHTCEVERRTSVRIHEYNRASATCRVRTS